MFKPLIDTMQWLGKHLGKLIPNVVGDFSNAIKVADLQSQVAKKMVSQDGASNSEIRENFQVLTILLNKQLLLELMQKKEASFIKKFLMKN